jgi:hypothetical protein
MLETHFKAMAHGTVSKDLTMIIVLKGVLKRGNTIFTNKFYFSKV